MKSILELVDEGYEIDSKNRLVHRVVYEQANGHLPDNWIVIHVDNDKKNNNLDNLVAIPAKLIRKIKSTERKNKIKFTKANIESLVRAYVNLARNSEMVVYINVIVSETQRSCETDKLSVKAKLVNKSGSYLYR